MKLSEDVINKQNLSGNLSHGFSMVTSVCILTWLAWLHSANCQTPDLVFVGFRHANRNPIKFLPNDPNKGKWGFEGEAQLNDIGKKQAHGLGKLLRIRYKNLISDHWNSSEIEAISSSADRCQQTTQLVLAGLYPPKTWAKWNSRLMWQPIPVKIDDRMLRTYATKCPSSQNAWKPVDQETFEAIKNLKDNNEELVEFVTQETEMEATVSNMADIADNLEQIHSRHLTMPDWVTNNPFNYSLFDQIMQFSEAPQIACATHLPCRKMMAGYWLNHVFEKTNGFPKSFPQKLFIYGTHNEIASSFLQLLGVNQNGLPYNGAFLLEVSKQLSEPLIRLVYSETVQPNPYVRNTTVIPLCDQGDWCPLEPILDRIADNRVTNWRLTCGLDECD